MDNKKPSPTTQSARRKSTGSCTQLRSPVVKRPTTAPVALQGWLHKQGSEGLMLWKKRWFVLSEYCLFYYKGPEEEKLLGSILLPSYKVSPCTAEDKVYRKFAFKAEHANMRTYYFAAETRELMIQWTNALSLASILQEGSKLQNQNQSSVAKRNFDDSNPSYPGYRQFSSPITVQPTSQDKNTKDEGGNVNGWHPPHGPYQPLYANAPPKPKRWNNEGQYVGSSPEASPNRRDDNVLYGSRRQFQEAVNPHGGLDYHYYSHKSEPESGASCSISRVGDPSTDRTRDYLGWNNVKASNFVNGTPVKVEQNSNYSDVFKNGNYNRNLSNQVDVQSYSNYGFSSNSTANYQHPNQYYQSYQQPSQKSFDVLPEDITCINLVKKNQPPRPHSADFLDYDSKKYHPGNEVSQMMDVNRHHVKGEQYNPTRPPRPKSSLDIVHTNDGYYWSEECYAEKMRQSAMYLQNTLPQRSPSSKLILPGTKRVTSPTNAAIPSENVKTDQLRQQKINLLRDVTKSPSRQALRRWSEHPETSDNNGFVRSASARLPKLRKQDDESDEVQAYTGGEDFNEGRKEESMRRLLEWKQRMLQSPLTRKSSGSSTRGVAQNELSKFYKQQVLKELEKQEARTREELSKGRSKQQDRIQTRSSIMSDGRKSAILSADRYYGYSSDDEENEKISEKRKPRTSQSKISWKEGEDCKGKKPAVDPEKTAYNFASPNYENVAQAHDLPSRFHSYPLEPSCQPEEKFKSSEQPAPVSGVKKKARILKSENCVRQPEQTRNASGKEFPSKNFNKGSEVANEKYSDRESHKAPDREPFRSDNSLKKTNWNKKIDESKLIKEFSYQYIKDPQVLENSSSIKTPESENPLENVAKNRGKQSRSSGAETNEKDEVIKEPLKVTSSSYSLNEAHVSNLKSSDETGKLQEKRSETSKFALGENFKEAFQEPSLTDVPEKQQKSVKDLLADFERKSQLAQEREAMEHERSFDELPGKRCVFSDTETLLYDTSSDTEEKKQGPDPSILNSLRKPELTAVADELTEEEDKDDEVVAVLSRRERYFNSFRDMGRKRDPEYVFQGKRQQKLSDVLVQPSPSSDQEPMSSGYIRSPLSESVAPREHSDSTCSTPTIERIKDNLEKTLPVENLNRKITETPKEEDNCEGHYMPMTPSRRVSAPPSDKSRSNSSLHSFLFGADAEETYVEMSENGVSAAFLESNKSSLSKIRKSYQGQDGPGYCEGNSEDSPYDFLSCGNMIREPEYMEVNTLLEILKEQDEKIKEHKNAVEDKIASSHMKMNQDLVPPTPPRSALPDILNSSKNIQNTKSDSSDADDESSKDLDSLDIPRHPRFSLSDTFRPASYYLGSAINGRDRNIIRLPNPTENHDSSDSDLVSPPPIPTSPLPLDDLDTSLETEKSLELRNQTPSLKPKLGSKESIRKLWINPYDAEHIEDSIKKKRRPVSYEMLETLEESDNFFYEKPLIFSELDSIGSRNGLALDGERDDINLDQYLEELQFGSSSASPRLYSKNFRENIYKGNEKEMRKNLMSKESVSKVSANEKGFLKMKYADDNFKENEEPSAGRTKSTEEVQYENIQALFPPPPPELYESSNEQSDKESSLTSYRNNNFPEVPPPDNYCDVYEPPENSKLCFDPDTLQHQAVNTEAVAGKSSSAFQENQGAPYYYSDIIKNDDGSFNKGMPDKNSPVTRGHFGGLRYQTLNNQRDSMQEINQCGKRNDIGRKVNPISQNYLAMVNNQTSDQDYMQKITAELRTTSAHFMGATDKSGTVDLRNIYESDTLQRRKATGNAAVEVRPRVSGADSQGINLFPQGIKDKTSEANIFTNCTSAKFSGCQNRGLSRSVEGLLQDSGRPKSSGRAESAKQAPGQQPSRISSSRIHPYEGDDLWDKDALWRENLRKVSLRHTRSLDNLDDDNTWNASPRASNPSERRETLKKSISGRRSVDHFTGARENGCPSGRRSADHFSNPSRSKLSRNVTYVNDVVRPNRSLDLTREYEDYREGRFKPRKKESGSLGFVELGGPVAPDPDDGVHYEKLTRNRSAAKPSRRAEERASEDAALKKDEEASPKKRPPYLGDDLHPNRGPAQPTESPALEPIDREKLRQWDLMSSGTVEASTEQKKGDESEAGKESAGKKVDEITSAVDFGEYVTVEQRVTDKKPQELSQAPEASGSGSAMREPHLPRSASTTPQPSSSGREIKKVSHQSASQPQLIAKEERSMDPKMTQTVQPLADFVDRIDYYDRGKALSPSNGYLDRNDDLERRGLNGADELIGMPSERIKPLGETNYYVDQYQEPGIGGYHRTCGTLPVTKSPSIVPGPGGVNYQSSSLGRALDTGDGRYLGKENMAKRKVSTSPWGLDVSAGELLGRTHEELVLLLIQLRRQSASVCKAMETCHIEIEEQARLADLDTPKRMEHIRKLEKLKKHLLELEKQYEKGKPLVNLVDNMVKLGSLYRGNNYSYNGTLGTEHSPNVREKLEFNQKVQEQRLLAEERRDWDRITSDHGQLQAKVQQLYKLDRLLQEESGTLQSLQQDKELLEKALGGLRHKLQVNRSNPVEADRYRKQQKLLEKELSRVRLLLAHNSKKLEETVAENARLEQELVILRQKLQASRVSSRSSIPIIPESSTLSTTAALEAELRRVQQLVGDLQRQRHELSAQVKQLTEKSDTLVQQIRPGPTGVAGAGPIPGKKKSSATWLETDLDLLITQDVGIESQVTSPQLQQQSTIVTGSRSTTPIYINTETSKRDISSPMEESGNLAKSGMPPSDDETQTKTYCTPVELSEADERMKRFYGIIPKEKQEIKTVRIVKRESERRQRDRDRSGNIGIPVGNIAVAKRVSVIEENDGYGLGRVEEESYESGHSPSVFGYEEGEPKSAQFGIPEDPYKGFHPTNPFLPQNFSPNGQEMSAPTDSDRVSSPTKRSMSLPRGFGKSNAPGGYDENPGLRNVMSKRNRVRFENQNQDGSESESGLNSPINESPSRGYSSYGANQGDYPLPGRMCPKSYDAGAASCYGRSEVSAVGPRLGPEPKEAQEVIKRDKGYEMARPLSAREQLFGSNYFLNEETSPQLSPVYQSEAAREIIMEMSSNPARKAGTRRQVRKEKRRHHTVSNIRHVTNCENHFSKMGSARSRDDLDMERALRPRMNAPDVVRSTMNHKDLKYNESTIDNILGTPNKIVIPERYIPEQEPMLSAEELMQRSRKAESIRKMLSETTALSTPDLNSEGLEEEKKSCTLRKKVEEEKKQREHLLELNQILAQQVMEKSKLVAVQAMASMALEGHENSFEEDDLSPVRPLPIYQQRENFFS